MADDYILRFSYLFGEEVNGEQNNTNGGELNSSEKNLCVTNVKSRYNKDNKK